MIKTLAKLGLAAALLTFVAQRAGVEDALDRVLALPPVVSLGAVAVYLAALAVQSLKLRILLPESPIVVLFRVTMLGQFYGLVLFGQIGGDVARTVYLARSHQDAHKVVAASLFDRVTGLIGLLALTLAALGMEPDRFDPALLAAMTALAGAIALGFLALLLPVGRAAGAAPWRRLERIAVLPVLAGHLRRLQTALRAFAVHPRLTGSSILGGVLFQAMIVANFALLGAGVGIDLPLAVWAVVAGIVSVVLLIPVSVGGIGLRDVTLVGVLAGFGVPADAAFALSLILLGLHLFGGAIGGLWSLPPWPRAGSTEPGSALRPTD